MSSVTSPPLATTEPKKAEESKPVKLRSACNCCFAAKVRCNGNKEGCKRCSEKHLDCTYSESMVGKVVGKRRKRPLPDSRLSDCKANPWAMAVGPTALPSPASTYISDQPSKRTCISNDWTNLITYDQQSPLDYSAYDEQFINLDLCQESSSMTTSDDSYIMNAGLPTPSMSPPDMQFIPPADLGAPSHSSSCSTKQSSRMGMMQPTINAPSNYQQHFQVEDDETLCIQLLAHLKRSSSRTQQPLVNLSSLVRKTNAALKRLLRSRTIRSEYTCHLLLTNIMLHLATICEQLLLSQNSHRKAHPEQEFINECYLAEDDEEACLGSGSQNLPVQDSIPSAKTVVQESASLCSKIGDYLKRKPLNGFQILGRQESALIEVEVRLKSVIKALP